MNSITCSWDEYSDSAPMWDGNDSALTHVGYIMQQEQGFGDCHTHRCVYSRHTDRPLYPIGYVEE